MKKNVKRNMKSSILILVLVIIIIAIILIKSKAPKVEIEEAKPVEETPIEEPKEIIEEELKEPKAEETSLEENIIEIKEDSFYPKEKTIEKNTEIKWVKKDTRNYKIVCYLEGTRVIQSPDLKEGDSFTYTFLQEGGYTCITTPYGLRSTITVEAAPLLSPTTSAVIRESTSIKTALTAIALIAIGVLLFFIYGRKRQ